MNESLPRLLLLGHLAATLFMTGLIWFVQVVHYPLFSDTSGPEFANYHRRHSCLTTWVVGPPMLIEGATAVLLFWYRPAGVAAWQLWTGIIFLAFIWLATALVQVPCHEALSRGFDPLVHERLVQTNWLRTATWTLRGLLALWMFWASLR